MRRKFGGAMRKLVAMPLAGCFVLTTVLLSMMSAGRASQQCMAHWSCSSEQCAAVMGGSSGNSGLFDSESECHAWADQYNRNTACDCSDGSVLSNDSHIPMGGLSPQQAGALAIGTLGIEMIFGALMQDRDRDQQAVANAQARIRHEQAVRA